MKELAEVEKRRLMSEHPPPELVGSIVLQLSVSHLRDGIWRIGRNEWGGKIKKVHFSHWLTLFSMYFSILRTIYFLAFLD